MLVIKGNSIEEHRKKRKKKVDEIKIQKKRLHESDHTAVTVVKLKYIEAIGS